jgi:hypothetical protein
MGLSITNFVHGKAGRGDMWLSGGLATIGERKISLEVTSLPWLL